MAYMNIIKKGIHKDCAVVLLLTPRVENYKTLLIIKLVEGLLSSFYDYGTMIVDNVNSF